ncbi:MAG TPA: hypothetical protein VJ577_19025 [Burkholderiaceae bacterium]|nr:hypothetical protein [Burkholderiaceae bacterium]
MKKHSHRLILARYALAIGVVKLLSKVCDLLGVIFNYHCRYATHMGP